MPEQDNSSDCGVFLLTNASAAMLDVERDYDQSAMDQIRLRIALTILETQQYEFIPQDEA